MPTPTMTPAMAVEWASLPQEIASKIVLIVLKGHRDAAAVARLLAPLSLVCRAWRAAVEGTLLPSLSIADERHLSTEAAVWLSQRSVAGLSFPRSLSHELQDRPAFALAAAGPSAPLLRRLAGLPSLQVLPPAARLRSLRSLALHCPQPRLLRRGKAALLPFDTLLDLALLQGLSSLRRLSISGHFQLACLCGLPLSLSRLCLSSHSRQISLGGCPALCLPSGLHLASLRLKARLVTIASWAPLAGLAHSVHVAASRLLLGLPGGSGQQQRELGDAVGYDLALYRSFAQEVAAATELDQVELLFQRMQFYMETSAGDGGGASPRAGSTGSDRSTPAAGAALNPFAGGTSSGLPQAGLGAASGGPATPELEPTGAAVTGLVGPLEQQASLPSQSSMLVEPASTGWQGALAPSPRRGAQREVAAAWVDGFELLEAVRGELVGSHSVATCYASCCFSGDDVAHDDVASVLRVERQREGAPRSFSFLTPTSPKERAMLQSTPVAALGWCHDPHAFALLHSRAFAAQSAATLRMLGPIPFTPGLDLSPFCHLSELHGLLELTSLAGPLQQQRGQSHGQGPAAGPGAAAGGGSGTELWPGLAAGSLSIRSGPGSPPRLAIVLPASLAILGLQAWDAPAPHFEAGVVAGLSSLTELRLGGFATHDLRALLPTVALLTITNPRTAGPLGGGSIQLPSWEYEGRGSRGSSGSRDSGSGDSGSACPPQGSALAAGGSGRRRRLGGVAARLLSCWDASRIGGGSGVDTAGRSAGGSPAQFQLGASQQQPSGSSGGAAYPVMQQPLPPMPSEPAVPSLHLHLTSALNAELALDLSWALSQRVLRRLTLSGSSVRQGQTLCLHLAGGWAAGSWERAAGRELARQLAGAPGLEALAVCPNLATAKLLPSPPPLLRRLGLEGRQLALGRVLRVAAQAQACAPAGGGRSGGGRPGGASRWRVESRVAAGLVEAGSEEGEEEGGWEWVVGVREGGLGFRVAREVAS